MTRTTRRSLLRGVAVIGLGAVGVDLLAACSAPAPKAPTSIGGAATSGGRDHRWANV